MRRTRPRFYFYSHIRFRTYSRARAAAAKLPKNLGSKRSNRAQIRGLIVSCCLGVLPRGHVPPASWEEPTVGQDLEPTPGLVISCCLGVLPRGAARFPSSIGPAPDRARRLLGRFDPLMELWRNVYTGARVSNQSSVLEFSVPRWRFKKLLIRPGS